MTLESRDGPIRTCVGCGETAPQSRMMRLHADADGELHVAAGRMIAGRTAYLHASEVCVRALRRSKRLFRSLRRNVEERARERFIDLALEVLARERAKTQEYTVA